MATRRQSLITDEMLSQLSAADKLYKQEPGTMYALMMQESSGMYGPKDAHYADGKSTASGPFGILDGTARDPGYGVKPLDKSTGSFADHLAFAGSYLSKRGLAAYGEGEKYAQQVTARIRGGKPSPKAAIAMADPTALAMVAQAVPKPIQQIAPEVVAPVQQPMLAQQVVPIEQPQDPWGAMEQAMPSPILANSFNYGGAPTQSQQQTIQPNFSRFSAFKGRT